MKKETSNQIDDFNKDVSDKLKEAKESGDKRLFERANEVLTSVRDSLAYMIKNVEEGKLNEETILEFISKYRIRLRL